MIQSYQCEECGLSGDCEIPDEDIARDVMSVVHLLEDHHGERSADCSFDVNRVRVFRTTA